ncbi:MAG: ferrous iron transport protein A [Chloroflexi bacterium]|nr:ferrous iron transport protein A [Chloroflexota bacterium]
MSQNETYPLSMAVVGEPVRLKQIDAGRKLTCRLMELGLTPGVELTVVQDSGGPLLVAVRDSRVALGRGMAHKMRVELLANGKNGHR